MAVKSGNLGQRVKHKFLNSQNCVLDCIYNTSRIDSNYCPAVTIQPCHSHNINLKMNLRLCSASKAKTVALMTFLCLTERYSAYTTDGMPKSFIKNIPESGKGIDTGFDVSAWKNGYTNCPQEVSSIMILTGNICSKS